jgi:hypothetical protein
MDPKLRRSLYSLFLVVATGLMVARVVNVEVQFEPSLYKAYPTRKWPKDTPPPWPTFSSNDRARWATVKALVEKNTFVIGERVPDATTAVGYRDTGIAFDVNNGIKGFGSVDVVLHPETSEFFSTKPPLLTVIVAGEYWLLHHFLHKNIDEHKWEVVVPILLLTNVLPLVLALYLLALLIERYGTTDWGRLFTFAAACGGTFLTTFAITLNNHVPAACCIVYAIYAVCGSGRKVVEPPYMVDGPPTDGLRSPLRLIIAGLFAGTAICMDLPAAAFAGAVAFLILRSSWKGLIWFIPALLLPIAAQTWINYKAIGTWEPVYAKFGGPWYEYPGSHWIKRYDAEQLALGNKVLKDPPEPGIDFINEPKEVYAFNFLIGHHGLLSLTPIWLLSLAGMAFPQKGPAGVSRLHRLTPLILAVVIGFYIWRTNNYGGWSSGPRWLFWLTPLLLLAMLPAVDRMSQARGGRWIAYLCLGASAFSATYTWANPWRHPWIYQWAEYMDWVHY